MPATILIVEDDQPTLGGLASLFENAGYTVITANTYVAGREALQTRDPDLLLVDIRLGAFNGLQIVAARPRPIPSIVLTGHADVVLELEARRFGAEYLVKPVAPSVLLALVRAKLENPSVARTQRRWPRKQLVAFVPVWVNQWSGRLIDISYGGARLEVDDRFASLSGKVHISVPSRNVTVSAHVVWAAQSEAGCVVGTELLYDSQQADAWRNLVNHSLSR